MKRNLLGSSGLAVSPLALGTWAMSGYIPSWGAVDDRESIAAIHEALDLGVNLIDTAPIYGMGHAEEIVGKAVHARRLECVIATKCGLLPSDNGHKPPTRCLNGNSILRECEASLRRMKIDVIDVLQCHWPDPSTPMGETMTALMSLREQGKVRAIGVSNFSVEQICEARKHGRVDVSQVQFSMLHRQARSEMLPYCRENGIGVLAYSPLSKGLLTGKFNADSPMTGIRAADREFLGQRFRNNLARVSQLRDIASRLGRTPAQLALNWAISEPGLCAAIMGAKRPGQVKENLGAMGWSMTPDDRLEIERIFEET